MNTDRHVQVVDDEIIVTAPAFHAAYCKPRDQPQLVLRRRTATDDHELLARAWQAANEKAQRAGVDRIRGRRPKPTPSVLKGCIGSSMNYFFLEQVFILASHIPPAF
jgi:hypothetical protein